MHYQVVQLLQLLQFTELKHSFLLKSLSGGGHCALTGFADESMYFQASHMISGYYKSQTVCCTLKILGKISHVHFAWIRNMDLHGDRPVSNNDE